MSTTTLKAPAVQSQTLRLRVLGTPVTLLDPIREAAEADLGVKLDFILRDGTEAQRMGVLEPDAFDVYDQWFHDIDMIWPAASLQPIEIARINAWDALSRLPHLSADPSDAPWIRADFGRAPAHRLYVQYNGELAAEPTDQVSLVPTVHNADGFAIFNLGEADLPDSWSALLEPGGQVAALQADAAIGAVDAILALTARGELSCRDIGNLTLDEINGFIDLLSDRVMQGGRKRLLHFWHHGHRLAALAEPGLRVTASMWWSVYLDLRAKGIDVRMITPKEGCRGWYGGLGLSRQLSGREMDAAYDYINWWHDGFVGAVMARNGAYMGDPEAVRRHLSEDEMAFWYDGETARTTIHDPRGRPIYEPGALREGGTYEDRMSSIAVWNTVMDEHNYLVRRWGGLLVGN